MKGCHQLTIFVISASEHLFYVFNLRISKPQYSVAQPDGCQVFLDNAWSIDLRLSLDSETLNYNKMICLGQKYNVMV